MLQVNHAVSCSDLKWVERVNVAVQLDNVSHDISEKSSSMSGLASRFC